MQSENCYFTLIFAAQILDLGIKILKRNLPVLVRTNAVNPPVRIDGGRKV